MGKVNRYNVRVDGQVAPRSYTYEELLVNDFLELDDIEIQKVGKSNWTIVTSYYFPEEHEDEIRTSTQTESAEFYVDENGQAHFQNKQHKNAAFEIDEFGQMIKRGGSSSSSHGSNSPSSASSSDKSSSSSDDNTVWKVIGTIFTIAIVIGLFATGVIGGTVAGICGAMAIRQIWNDN